MPSQIDINGFKEIKDNPLSRIGVFPYLGSSIPGAPDPTKIYYVHRPAEELADPECIESFKLIPWVDEHTMLGGDFTPAEQKGIQGIVGEDVYFRDGFLRGNLKIFSSLLERLITSGKRELSCGYRCMYEAAPGVFEGKAYDYVQRKIRGNHLALVDEGRMGPDVAVQDKLDVTYTFTLDSKELLNMAEEDKDKPVVPAKAADDDATGGEGESTGGADMTLSELVKLVKSIMPQIAAVNAAVAALTPKAEPDADPVSEEAKAMDSKVKALTKEVTDLKAGVTKSVINEVNRRNQIYSQLSSHVGAFDHAEMTVAEIAGYGVKKLGIMCDAGSELAALTGYLHNRTTFQAKPTVVLDSKTAPQSTAVATYISEGGN